MTLTFGELENYWTQAGGSPLWAPTMAAIAYFESGGNPQSVQQGQPYATTGWGLWQITPGDSESAIGTNEALLDPGTNARAAVAKFKSQGIGAWQGDPAGNAALSGGPLSLAAAEAMVTAQGFGSYVTGGTGTGGTGTAPAGTQGAATGGPCNSATCKVGFGGVLGVGSTCFVNECQLQALKGGVTLIAGGFLGIIGLTIILLDQAKGPISSAAAGALEGGPAGAAAALVMHHTGAAGKKVGGAAYKRRDAKAADQAKADTAGSKAVKAKSTATKSPVEEGSRTKETPHARARRDAVARRQVASRPSEPF